jgi:hypothetical protein
MTLCRQRKLLWICRDERDAVSPLVQLWARKLLSSNWRRYLFSVWAGECSTENKYLWSTQETSYEVDILKIPDVLFLCIAIFYMAYLSLEYTWEQDGLRWGKKTGGRQLESYEKHKNSQRRGMRSPDCGCVSDIYSQLFGKFGEKLQRKSSDWKRWNVPTT